MADGRTHELFNLLAATSGTALLYASGYETASTGFLAGALFGTFLVTPDLDFAGKNPVRPLRFWGVLRYLWYPYGLIFKHRGISHTWISGPLTRLLYMMLIFFLLLGFLPDYITEIAWVLQPYLPSFLAGYFFSQWSHLVLDGIYPWQPRRLI